MAQELGTSAAAVVEDAGLTLVGHSSLKAALDLDWGQPSARARALGLVLKEVMETITRLITQDTEPDPEGGPGGRWLKQHVAPDRRVSIEDQAMRHGRKSSVPCLHRV